MTMNATAPAAPAAAPIVDAPKPTIDQRAAAAKEKLEALPLEGGETAESVKAEPQSTTQVAAPEATADTAAEARNRDRLARIAEVRKRENAQDIERQKRQAGKAAESEIEKLRKRVADLEPMEEAWKDPLSMLAWAEKKKLDPNEVIKVLRDRVTNPEIIAQHQASAVEQKLRAELEATNKKIADLEAKMADERTQVQRSHESMNKAQHFVDLAGREDVAQEYPLVTNYFRAKGADRLIQFANANIAPNLTEGYSLQELFDAFEQHLDEAQVGGSPVASAPPNGTSQPAKKNGSSTQPVTTLSNAITAGRESLVEEVALHKLSRAERERRLREKLASES